MKNHYVESTIIKLCKKFNANLKEEIKEAAKQSIKGDSFEDGCIGKGYFIIGAEWADANPDGKMLLHVLNRSAEQMKKLMIDKVCDYLASNMKCDGYTTQTKAKFIQSVRKAMEE